MSQGGAGRDELSCQPVEAPADIIPSPEDQSGTGDESSRVPPIGAGQSFAQVEVEGWSGPVPDPRSLERYENLLPGAAERAFLMAEHQLQHRMSQERGALQLEREAYQTARLLSLQESKRSTWGMAIAGVIAIVALVGGIVLCAIDKWEPGLTVFLTSLMSLVGVFLYEARARRAERHQDAMSDNPRDGSNGSE